MPRKKALDPDVSSAAPVSAAPLPETNPIPEGPDRWTPVWPVFDSGTMVEIFRTEAEARAYVAQRRATDLGFPADLDTRSWKVRD